MDWWVIAVGSIYLDRLIIAFIHNQGHVRDVLCYGIALLKQCEHHGCVFQIARADQNIDIVLFCESCFNCIILLTNFIQCELVLMLLEDSPVGSGYSEETIISHTLRSITVEQLVEGSLFEVV